MMTKINCLNNISHVGLNAFSKAYEITDHFDEADVLLVRSANMHEMTLPSSVVAVARAGAGVNNIPYMDYAKKGIVVFNTPGANANAVKELIIAAMLNANRDLHGGLNWVKANEDDPNINKSVEKMKAQFAGGEILGKSIGIIGLGAIGIKLANACHALGMKVIGFEKNTEWLNQCKSMLPADMIYKDTLDEFYPLCDYISVNVPFMPATKDLIDKVAMKQMKKSVILMNFARDGIVNEDAVIEALNEGLIQKYLTDFPTAKIMHHDKITAYPHLGASTEEAEDNCAYMAAMQVQDYLENGNIKNSVNFPNVNAGQLSSKSRVTVLYEQTEHIDVFMKKITECEHKINQFVHAERNGFGYAIIDTDEPIDQVTINAIDNLKGVIKIRVIPS